MNQFYPILLFLLICVWNPCLSQTIEISGLITDSLQLPLEGANLLLIPNDKSKNIKFSITDAYGKFKIKKIQANEKYKLEISFLGYNSIEDSINIDSDKIFNYRMLRKSQGLDEINISVRIPIKIREDTITYRPEKFLTGEERKLRDVLKKLPGLEVDRAGNVTVNGKAVTKLLVDGKEFFTGDEKLGVNNIPAGVVDEIEALDNYSEISFLKGLSDSEQLALNIKLKDGKKEFAFGELEGGGGIENRYLIHPTLFYYSPKTSVNFIGDINNIGKKSFTTQDYVNFEGGFARFNEDPSAYFNLFNDEFAQFLSQRDFIFNRNNFGAFSINQNLSSHLNLSAYTILSSGDIETRQENEIAYLTDENLNEERLTTHNNDVFFSLTKTELRFIGNKNLDIKYEQFLKTNKGETNSNLQSFTLLESTFLKQANNSVSSDFTQKLSINKQFNREHTTSINSSHKYIDSDNVGLLKFNRPIFSGLIPLEETDDAISLNQLRKNKGHDLNFNVKHYWVLHRYHHIYPEAGIRYIDQMYDTEDSQNLASGTNSFAPAGFDNDLDYRLSDSYAGFQYKAKAGKFIIKPGIFYHYYAWKISQGDSELRQTGKTVVLPELSIDWKINSSHKLKLRYNLNSRFGQASQFANRLRLNSFNQIFTGNERLENDLYHSARATYSKFSLFKGVFFNAGVAYTNRLKSIRNITEINGINQINTLVYTALPENAYRVNFLFTKILGDYKIKLGSTASFSEYSRNINNLIRRFESQNYSYNLGVNTNFKDAPNIEFSWNQSFNIFDGPTITNRFTQINPSINLEYRFLKDFVFDGNYNFTYYENLSQNEINRFSLGNTSLLYNQEDSPWTFTIDVDNLFDTRLRNENSFSQFLVSDSRTFLQPRTILFKIGFSF